MKREERVRIGVGMACLEEDEGLVGERSRRA
jgi:hypothetical protein